MKRVRMYATLALLAARRGGDLLHSAAVARVGAVRAAAARRRERVRRSARPARATSHVKPGDSVEQGRAARRAREPRSAARGRAAPRPARLARSADRRAARSCMFDPDAAAATPPTAWPASEEQLAAIDEQLAQEGEGPRAAAHRRPDAPARSSRRRASPDRPQRRRRRAAQLDRHAARSRRTSAPRCRADGPQNLFCQIGDPNAWDAVLVIDQDDVDLVREGQEVRLMFEESAYHVFVSTIEQPAPRRRWTQAPPRLASTNGGPLPAKAEPDGTVRPLSTSYQAVAPLDNRSGLLAQRPDRPRPHRNVARARSPARCTATSAARSISICDHWLEPPAPPVDSAYGRESSAAELGGFQLRAC